VNVELAVARRARLRLNSVPRGAAAPAP